jgi:hypothetical protein
MVEKTHNCVQQASGNRHTKGKHNCTDNTADEIKQHCTQEYKQADGPHRSLKRLLVDGIGLGIDGLLGYCLLIGSTDIAEPGIVLQGIAAVETSFHKIPPFSFLWTV